MGVISMNNMNDVLVINQNKTKKLNEKDEKIRDILAKRRMCFSSANFNFPIITIDIGTNSTEVDTAIVTYIVIKTPRKN